MTPTTPRAAVTIADGGREETPPPGGVSPLLRNTVPFDIFGLPTISIPCGFTRGGLPIGLQVQGDYFSEAAILNVAHRFQQATDWHMRSPLLAREPGPQPPKGAA